MKFTSLAQLSAYLTPPKMDYDTQQTAISGLLTQLEDFYFIRHKHLPPSSLRTYIQESLKKVGPLFSYMIEKHGRGFIYYGSRSSQERRDLLEQNYSSPVMRLYVFLLRKMLYSITMNYVKTGENEADLESQWENDKEKLLSAATLGELHNNITLTLYPGNVAGADRRLKAILKERITEGSYIQDCRVALWKLLRVINESIHQELNYQATDEAINNDQVDFIIRLYRGQEANLVRKLQLRVIRKIISDLSDIKSDISEVRKQEAIPGMAFVRDQAILQSIPCQTTFHTNNKADSLLPQLKPHELDLYYSELERLRENKTRSQWYGQTKAEKVKQQLKYMRSKYS